jgi:protein-tyrosine phosphatase
MERMAKATRSGAVVVRMERRARLYVALRDNGDGSLFVTAERALPLERGSNFRDLGGYLGAGGRRVVWGRIFRSGALPLLSEGDYELLSGLGISAIVDLRSTEERAVAPTLLDDRTGALFLSNDYSIAPMLTSMRADEGRPLYADTVRRLAPQYRMLFRRLLANDGAVLFHCSAGQDRTGVGAALVLSALGVSRRDIIEDYHLSTSLRRPEYEMPRLDPEAHPGNPIVALYAASQARPGGMRAEPLFDSIGRSHIAVFLEYLDAEYGGHQSYLEHELGINDRDIRRLREMYLR